MKFGLLSFLAPPSASGMAMVLYQLLKELPGEDYCLITQHDYSQPSPDHSYTEMLPASYHTLPIDTVLSRGARFRLPQRAGYVYITLGILLRARHIARILRSERCEALVACTGGWDCLNLPAGYLASRMVGIPCYAYIFDYYSKQWEGPNYWGRGKYLGLARRLEAAVVKGAVGVFVPNEYLGDSLRKDYQIEATVIHDPSDLSRYEMTYQEKQIGEGDEVSIVYTGDIYDAHFDAFSNLMDAIARLDRKNVKLHAYTIRTAEYLSQQGVSGPIVLHPHAPSARMPEIQGNADVLFLALAFRSPYPEGNLTASPAKMTDYMAAGRPILVHAPSDSYTAWYFRKHDCGLVVDVDDAAELARGLERLLTDDSLRRRLVTNALKRAREDFDVVSVREKFIRLLKPGARRGAGFGLTRRAIVNGKG